MTRDDLAVIRTHLANERTLLGYFRTALALFASGAGLVSFVPTTTGLALGWTLLATGLATAIAGTGRFFYVRTAIGRAAAHPIDHSAGGTGSQRQAP